MFWGILFFAVEHYTIKMYIIGIVYHQRINIMVRVVTNGLGDQGSIPVRVIPRTQKIVLDALLNTQHYKVQIKGKVEQFRERNSALLYTLV